MAAEKQSELTRIVAVRGCGHVAAFATLEQLLREKDRCPLCAAAPVTVRPPTAPTIPAWDR